MDEKHDTAIEGVLEQPVEHGPADIGRILGRLFDLAMRMEREDHLGAGHQERTPGRRGYANGYKPKRVDTPAGTVTADVPKTAGHGDDPFQPRSLERGRRSCRAAVMAVAEMHIKGVSTRQAEAAVREFGIESMSSTQVSRATSLLDEDLAAWRGRALGPMRYLILDARYEKARKDGVVRDVAVLSAVGIGDDERRHVLGVSVALSEAEVHRRAFPGSLQARGMRGTAFVVSDDHAGPEAARRAGPGRRGAAALPVPLGQRNAPGNEIRKRIGRHLRAVWNAPSLKIAEAEPADLAASQRDKHPDFADWLEENVPEGLLAAFSLPGAHRQRMPTSNGIERPIQQESERRTREARVFPGISSLERLATAVLAGIGEKWQTEAKGYIKWEQHDG